MYRREHRHGLSFEGFFLPFGGKLSRNNRWSPGPRDWCKSLGTSTPATPGLSAQLRHPALQGVGRPVTLV